MQSKALRRLCTITRSLSFPASSIFCFCWLLLPPIPHSNKNTGLDLSFVGDQGNYFKDSLDNGRLNSPIKITKDHYINKFSVENKPCQHIEDGTRLIFECWDALQGKAKEYYENNTPGADLFKIANPATGPVFVKGANPGDVLEVEIHDIKPSEIGYIKLAGNWQDEKDFRKKVYVEYEVQGSTMIYKGRKIPIEPMVGVMGTAGPEEIYCKEVGVNGGNMDTPLAKRGSKVWLPVFVEGGLLAMGDVHAIQGDGEVFGQGLEVGADVEVTVRVRKDVKLQSPLILTSDRIATIASDPDVLAAKDKAVFCMGNFLVEACGFDPVDASALIAFYGDLRFSQVVNPQKTVRMEIEKKHINLFEHATLPF